MRIDRLFHVLVVHGSLLVAGCDEASGPGEDGAPAEGDGSEDDGPGGSTSATTTPTDDTADDGPASADDGTGATDDAPSSTDDGPSSTDDAPSSTDDGPSTDDAPTSESSSGDPPELHCSEPAAPDDTCGCPCCWVLDCINTDECCAGFQDFCTPPV
jgi:predicted small secreted protein